MLGPVLRFNAEAAAPLYAELADTLQPGALSGQGVQARAATFVAAMDQLMTDSGAPRRLRDVGVTEADALMLYREAF